MAFDTPLIIIGDAIKNGTARVLHLNHTTKAIARLSPYGAIIIAQTQYKTKFALIFIIKM
ncbi:hypothetical protein IKE79_00445 [Candidatus Saccharibacteria bacterium]|nr:hypothetical protein [Candidatus Saccharibacteria bacterium]